MVRLIVALGLTIFIVIFGVANSREVYLSYVVGEPAETRLIFLLAIAFVAGSLTAIFHRMSVRAARRRDRVVREVEGRRRKYDLLEESFAKRGRSWKRD